MILSDRKKLFPVLLLLCSVFFAEAQIGSRISIPADTTLIKLAEDVVLETRQLTLEIEKGSYLVSRRQYEKFRSYESTLISARNKLVAQNMKIQDMVSAIQNLENKLEEISKVTREDLSEDIERLKVVEGQLEEARKDLETSNNDLEKIKKDLDKTTDKLGKSRKKDNLLKALAGAAGLVLGFLIGSAT